MLTEGFSNRFLVWLRYVHSLLRGVLVLFLLVIGVNSFLLTLFRVDGHSMDPTLHPGQVLLVSLQSYSFTTPQKGDIIIIAYEGNRTVRFVKRVAGVPGDTVMVNFEPITLKADEYYILGDNAPHSTDSRTFGPIRSEQIIGKALFPNFRKPWDYLRGLFVP
jgi:signal peptidase I